MIKCYEIKNQGDEKAEVWIYDVIGEDFWGEGVTAKNFVKEMSDLDVSQIDLHINSPGGSVWDGQAIFNAIKRHPANVTSFIDGSAFSIASVIAQAGDKVVMAENALMMIHNSWSCLCGNANDMRDSAAVLDKVDETISGVYQRKTGKDTEEIQDAMAEETWFTADEAVEFGLADETSAELKVAALQVDPETMARYKHAPDSLMQKEKASSGGFIKTPWVYETHITAEDLGMKLKILDKPGAGESSDGASQTEKENVYDFELERIKHRR